MPLSGRRQYWTFGAAALTGVQGVITLLIAKSALGSSFAPLAQLWAMWAVTAASMTYGTQQWSAVHPVGLRVLVTRDGRGLLVAIAGLSLALFVAALFVRERLFSSSAIWWPALAGVLPLGTSAVGLTRGELARRGETRWLSAVITGENSIRLVAVIVLAAVDAPAEWFGVALVAGFAVSVLPPLDRAERSRLDGASLSAAVVVGLASHALLFGAPLILALSGGQAEETVRLFLVLAAVRAPFVVLQALIPEAAVRFGSDQRRFASTVRWITVVGACCAVVVFIGGVIAGDWVVGTVFAIRGDVEGLIYGLVGATAMVSISLSLLTVRLVASLILRPLVVAWTVPVLATSVATVLGILDDLSTLSFWVLGVHVFALAVVAALSRTQLSHPAGQLGSELT